MSSDRNNAGITKASISLKRNNPYLHDESKQDAEKKRKIEQSVHVSSEPDETFHGIKRYIPIASLTPIADRLPIKGTLTMVSEWLTSQSGATFLTFRLRDESGEIGGIAFDPLGADFHKEFKLGATVILKKARVELSRGNYQNATEPYRLMINRYCSVSIESRSPAPTKPARNMISAVQNSSNEREVVDVLGILEDIGEVERNSMREIQIIDESETNIIITLWDNAARKFAAPLGSVIAAYRVAVRLFNGKKVLRTCKLSTLLIDPLIDDTRRLKKWYHEWKAGTAASWNVNSTSLIDNVVQRANDDTADNHRSEIVDTLASTLTSIKQQHYISVKAVLESPAGAIVATMGKIVEVFDKRTFRTKIDTVLYGRQFILRDEDGSEIQVRVMGREVLVNEIPSSSFAILRNANVSLTETKKLICGWHDMLIHPDASEIKRIQILSMDQPQRTRILQKCSPNTKAPAIASTAAFSQSEIHDVSYNIVGKCSTTATAENTECTVTDSSKASSTITLVQSNFMSIAAIKERAAAGMKIDLVGLVVNQKPLMQQMTRAGNLSWMSILILSDEKYSEIEMVVWYGKVATPDIPLYSVITGRNVMVREYDNEKSLSCLRAYLQINPNIPQAVGLKKLVANYSTTNETENSTVDGSSQVFIPKYLSRQSCPSQQIVFTTIKEINANATIGSKYDIVGIIVELGPLMEPTTKSGNILSMRTVVVSDEEDSCIKMNVWGKEVAKHDIPLDSPITATSVIVEELNRKKILSCLWVNLQINPNIPQAAELKKLAANRTFDAKDRFLYNDFTPFDQIKTKATIGSIWNVIGFVSSTMPPVIKKSKNGADLWMSTIKLKDSKRNEIELNIWKNELANFDIPLGSVITVKGAKAREFDDEIKLNGFWNSIAINPNIPAIQRLKELETRELNLRWPNFRMYVDDDAGDYTPIEVINRRNVTENYFNTIGLVVQMNSSEKREKLDTMRNVVLRGKDGSEIELNICTNSSIPFDIPMHSVIIARDVNLLPSKDEGRVALICRLVNLEINVDIPETKGFKEAAMNAPIRLRNSVAPELNNFTAFKAIKKKISLGTALNIIGLVVDVIKRDQTHRTKFVEGYEYAKYTVIVTLRDKDRELIVLYIRNTLVYEDDIKVNSVIAVRDAILRLSGEEKVLWCLRENVEIDPTISQADGLKCLVNIPFVRGFMPFVTIAQRPSLIGCKMDIIGQVIKIFPMMNVECDTDQTELPHAYILRNKIELKLHIWKNRNLEPSSTIASAISLNTIIAAKNATLTKYKGKLSLNTSWCCVTLNPKIPKGDRVTKSLGIVKINEIREEAQVGDNLGVLAVVTKSPRLVDNTIENHNPCEDFNDADEDVSELNMEFIELVDSSSKEINMKISTSVADILRENYDIPVVVLARNVEVRGSQDNLELMCTSTQSSIEFNPKTEDSRELLAWYTRNCNRKRENLQHELPISPISHVLENLADNDTASIMGILINTKIREVEKAGIRFESRRIQVIDESERSINIFMWNSAAKDFDVNVYSVILVRNICVYTKDTTKYGAFATVTTFTENPMDHDNVQSTKRLQTWFARYRREFENFTDTSAAGSAIKENLDFLFNDIKMVKNSKEIKENSTSFFENDDCSNENDERNSDCSNNKDTMDYDTDSPDLFADC